MLLGKYDPLEKSPAVLHINFAGATIPFPQNDVFLLIQYRLTKIWIKGQIFPCALYFIMEVRTVMRKSLELAAIQHKRK